MKRSEHTLTQCTFDVKDGSIDVDGGTVDIKVLVIAEGANVYVVPIPVDVARKIAAKLEIVVPSQGLMAIPGGRKG